MPPAQPVADSEPVIVVGDDGGDALSYRRLIQSFEPGTKLYRHAQPAPVVPEDFDFNRFNDVVWLECVASNPHMHSPTTSAIARVALELNKRSATMEAEPDRNPVLAYADSYRDMAKQGVESVPIWSVITDLERNIAPLYRHAQPAPVVLADGKLRELFDAWFASDCSFDLSPEASEADNIAWRESYWYVWKRCRAAMLQAGNSPVIPEGYVMVPKDLLSELRDWAHPEIEKYCEMWEGRRDSEFPALRKVIADADALLAASPQEVKDGK
ncbi:hypothetical protein [Klebsiella michiganensis]|uniref:hypothetical protein n=1 Tax=Klebsiella michiganensis TaxID=1134687 RepID=UPI0039C4AD65